MQNAACWHLFDTTVSPTVNKIYQSILVVADCPFRTMIVSHSRILWKDNIDNALLSKAHQVNELKRRVG